MSHIDSNDGALNNSRLQASRQVGRGFTLVELLVVIAIIGVLMAATFPALMASRETARRNLCRANMAQLLLALQSYENGFEVFPAGVINPNGPIRSEPVGLHQSWVIAALPYFDEQNVYKLIDLSKSVYDPANQQAREYWPHTLICPSEPNDVRGASSYAGCHHDVEAPIAADNRGVLFLNSQIRRDDVTDGMAHTFFLGEKRDASGDLGWMSGTRATLRNTGLPLNAPQSEAVAASPPSEPGAKVDQPAANPDADPMYVGGFASAHVGGAHMGFGDGNVQFVIDDIDLLLWQRMANRSDGQLSEHGERAK